MSWKQLREKAKKSRWARAKREIASRQEAFRDLAASYGSNLPNESTEIKSQRESLILKSLDMETCEQCGKETTSYDTHATEEGVKILCNICMPIRTVTNKKNR